MSDQSYLEIGRGIRNVYTSVTTLTRRLDLSPRVVHGVFNPEVQWDGQDMAVAQQRYGFDLHEAYKIGDGEAFSPDAVLEVALHPSNPLGINQGLVTLRPGGGVKNSQIYHDCMLVGGSPQTLAWRWFQTKHVELYGIVIPPPPPPPPVDPPPPPPPPPPVDPPPPVPPATMSDPAVRAEELASLLAPVYDAMRNRSFWTRRLPTWAELWPVAKPLAVELVKSVRRTAGRVR